MLNGLSQMKKIDRCLAFVLGLSVSEGISSIFKVGSTTFTISEIIAPIVLVWLLMHDVRALASFTHSVSAGYKLLFAIIILSIIPGMVYFMSLKIIYRYLVGVIYLVIILTIAIDVFLLREQKDMIIKGLFLGFIGNIIFSLLCFVAFQQGSVISLHHFVEREGFYVPTSSFRSQGFFLEPSHFIRYIGTVVFIIISMSEIKMSIIKYLIILVSIIVALLSYSGSLLILAVGLVIYWFGTRSFTSFTKIRLSTLAIVFVVLLTGILTVWEMDISSYFLDGGIFYRILTGADITGTGNAERFTSMQVIYHNLGSVVLGCGWNLTGSYIQMENLGITAAFSDILELFLETGLIGFLLYIFSLLHMSGRLWRLRDKYSRALSVTLLVILALQTGTDYALNTCIMLVFGLAIGQLADSKLRFSVSGDNK